MLLESLLGEKIITSWKTSRNRPSTKWGNRKTQVNNAKDREVGTFREIKGLGVTESYRRQSTDLEKKGPGTGPISRVTTFPER